MTGWLFLLGAVAIWAWSNSSAGQLARLESRTGQRLGLGEVPGALPAPSRAAIGLAVAALVMVVIPGLAGALLGATIGPGAFVVLGRMEQPVYRRRRERVAAQLPTTAELLAVTLSSGAPLRRAVAAVSQVSPPETSELLGRVGAFVAAGGSDVQAWAHLDDPSWAELARDVIRSVDSGTALADTLRLHAATARKAERVRLEAAAKRVGVQIALPLMCCFLPAFLAIGVAPIIFSIALNFFN